MKNDPLLETMIVDRALDKIDQDELEKEVYRLRAENYNLKKKLGYKNLVVQSYNYDQLVDENIKLKRKLGYSETEIIKSIKDNSPYKKSMHVWIIYMVLSGIIVIAMIIFLIVLLNKF